MDDWIIIFQQFPLVFYATVALLSALFGSFLNVVIYRLPIMMERQWRANCEEFLASSSSVVPAPHTERFNLAFPSSRCPHCGHAIRWWENIPLVSYIVLRGRCSQCTKPISIRYPLIEASTVLLSIVVAYKFGPSVQTIFALGFTWSLVALTMIDYDHQLLPDSITLPFLWIGILLSLSDVFVDTRASVLGVVFGYMSLWTVYHVFKWVTGKEGMGFGDFKLLAMLGAWLGWTQIPVIILLSSFVGAIVGVLLIIFRQHNRDKPIPFGPYLAAAGWISLLWGHELINLYLHFSGLN